MEINGISFFPSLFPYPLFYPHLRPALAKYAATCKIKRRKKIHIQTAKSLNSRVIKKLVCSVGEVDVCCGAAVHFFWDPTETAPSPGQRCTAQHLLLHTQAVPAKQWLFKKNSPPQYYVELTSTRRILSKLGFPPCWLLMNLEDEEERFSCMCSENRYSP